MAGLLDSLTSLFGGSGVDTNISTQSTALTEVIATVRTLIDGPTELCNLEASIDGFSGPPDISGIATLGSELGSVSVPTDFSGALSTMVSPLATLVNELASGGIGRTMAIFDLVREVIKLTTGQTFGGPEGMAEEGSFAAGLPDVDMLRGRISDVRSKIDAFGPRLDASKILEILTDLSTKFGKSAPKFIPIPVVDETMEALRTVANWQDMSAGALNANLSSTIAMAAELIATPRTRVARPIIDAGSVVQSGPSDLEVVVNDLTQVFPSLRTRIEAGNVKPSNIQLQKVEHAAEAATRLAAALHPDTSPFVKHDKLASELTRTLFSAVRALQPSCGVGSLLSKIETMIDAIPEAPENPFTEAVAAIEDFDISAVTGPLGTVREKVDEAVTAVEGAMETVEEELTELLEPVAAALESALEAVGFEDITSALESLPTELQNFIDTEIEPNIAGVRDSISSAVSAITTAASQFNPDTILGPLRSAIEDLAALLQDDSIQSTFAEVEEALNTAIQALQNIDLGVAADESISLIGEVEGTVAEIDLSSVPDAAMPLLEQAVSAVTDIDFTAEVSAPLVDKVEQAIQKGPAVVLGALEEAMDSVREQIEAFKPSEVIGKPLDEPFNLLLETLDQFQPSDLFDRLQSVLDLLADRVRVLDVGVVVDPLEQVHRTVMTQLEALRPSNLLKPVEDLISDAIDKVYEVTGIDTIFDGINQILELIQSWTDILADARDTLNAAADLFEDPGDASAAIADLSSNALAKLDDMDMGQLSASFTAASEAVALVDRNAIAGDLARALQHAGEIGPMLVQSDDMGRLKTLVGSFPLDQLKHQRVVPKRKRLVDAMEKLLSACSRLDAASEPWRILGPELVARAGTIQEELVDYYKAMQLDGGGVFAEFANPPATSTELRASVEHALGEGLSEPLTVVVRGFGAIAPYVRLMARGFSDLLGAIHTKIDVIVGEEGIAGTVGSVEEVVNILREIDLSIVTGPLDTMIWSRIESAAGALDPAPLRETLEAAREAIAGLLSVNTLIAQEDIDALNTAYQSVLTTIQALSPSALVAETLDPLYEELLGRILPILDLPARLRALFQEAGLELRDEIVRELARVEVAFDSMLRAIPIGGGGSVSASASASIG